MSKNTVSASATGLPISGHELSAAIMALTKARAEKTPLDALIEEHRAAYVAFEEICNFSDYVSEDDPSYPILEAENDRRSDAEEVALAAVCAFPARTLGDAESKARYILKHMRGGSQLVEEQVHALLRSFLSVGEDQAEGGCNDSEQD
jgi:hypothetical protein